MLSDCCHTLYFFSGLFNIPNFHGGVLGDRGKVFLLLKEAYISDPILMFLKVSYLFVLFWL